jgi:hypothetical protein
MNSIAAFNSEHRQFFFWVDAEAPPGVELEVRFLEALFWAKMPALSAKIPVKIDEYAIESIT